MKVWEFMEMVHSRSYTHIIKNIYSDPSEVFDTILKDDRILERQRQSLSLMMTLSTVPMCMTRITSGNFANEGHDLGKIERKELPRKLYRRS